MKNLSILIIVVSISVAVFFAVKAHQANQRAKTSIVASEVLKDEITTTLQLTEESKKRAEKQAAEAIKATYQVNEIRKKIEDCQ